MADVATRRDLSDATVADNLAATCAGDAERLRLLYLLTIGDSRATGPAAWGTTKGALLRDLFVKAAAAIERGAAAAVADDRRDALAERARRRGRRARSSSGCRTRTSSRSTSTRCVEHADAARVAASAVRCRARRRATSRSRSSRRDRPGLLATLAGALTVCGLDVIEAQPVRHDRRPRARRVPRDRSVRPARATAVDAGRTPAARRARRRARHRRAGRRSHARDYQPAGQPRRAPVAVTSTSTSRRPTRSSRCTPTTRSACSTGWLRRSPTSISTCASPRSRRSASASSTSSTSATAAGAKIVGSATALDALARRV